MTEADGKAVQRPDGATERPHQDQMQPYEWIYWALIDSGDDKLAESVRWLLQDYQFILGELRWERQQRAMRISGRGEGA